MGSLARSVRRLRFLGGAEDGAGRTAVMLDGRPRGLYSLAETRIVPRLPVLLRHVAEVEPGTGEEDMLFRVNGKLGQRSCGIAELKSGDTVLWRFQKYE